MRNLHHRPVPQCLRLSQLLKFSVLLSSLFGLQNIAWSQSNAELLIAAASDLAVVARKIDSYYSETYKTKLRFSFGATGMLSQQIRSGAPYDVYLSANERFMDDLIKDSFVLKESKRVYALGRLALWSRDAAIGSLPDLERPGVKHVAIANPAHAPYGQAATEALRRSGVRLAGSVVYAENVRQALQFAESGNAEAAIVAWSLVIGRRGAVLLPDSLHAPIRQAGGVVARSSRPAAARRFIDFLTAPDGRRFLEQYGFSLP